MHSEDLGERGLLVCAFEQRLRSSTDPFTCGSAVSITTQRPPTRSLNRAPDRAPRRVFISSTHEDTEFVEELAKALDAAGINVNRVATDIRPGDSLSEAIVRGIQDADVILFVISRPAEKSIYFSTEIALAMSAQARHPRKRIIPILIEPNAEIPLFLRDLQYIDLSPRADHAAGVKELIHVITEQPEFEDLGNSRSYQKELLRAEQLVLDRERAEYSVLTDQFRLRLVKLISTGSVAAVLIVITLLVRGSFWSWDRKDILPAAIQTLAIAILLGVADLLTTQLLNRTSISKSRGRNP